METKLVCHIEGASIFGADTRKEIQGGQLTIGRGAECDWVLADPDRALSKQHCVISRSPDGFVLTDTSTNGVFVNNSRLPLGRGQTAPLSDGHMVLIGPYHIRVSIQSTAATPEAVLPPALVPVAESWIGGVPEAGFGASRPPVQAGWDAPPDPHALGATGQPGANGFDAFSALAQHSESGSPLATVIRVPAAKAVLPLDWNAPAGGPGNGSSHGPASGTASMFGGAGDNPLGPLKPASVATPALSDNALADAFLEGAGLPPGTLGGSDARTTFHEFGRMLRCSVLGLRDLLASRKLAKAELRVQATTVKASGNNALKLSPDAERALQAIAGQPLPGFMPGADAIEEGLHDVKAHELALVATVSLLLNEINAQLDPAVIKAKAGGARSLLPASRRAQYWDEYEAAFNALVGAPGATLLSRFAAAYAEQAGQAIPPTAASGLVASGPVASDLGASSPFMPPAFMPQGREPEA